MNPIVTAIITVVVFLLIIMIHEFGHFLAAKAVKIKVEEFAIGFGPSVYKKQGKETLYSVKAFPIGGYVKMLGEDDSSDDPRAFNNKPAWARFIVMAAGAVFNLISGLIVFFFIYLSLNTYPTLEIGSFTTDIPNAPAATVLKEGDVITALNGKRLWGYQDFKFLMSYENDGSPVTLTVKRGGEKQDIEITPVLHEGSYYLGFMPSSKNMTPFAAVKCAVNETFYVMRLVIYSLGMLISGKVPITSMSGPIGTGSVIGEAASAGLELGFFGMLSNLFNIFALLAVNIGLFNLIPFPALDGGRIFFLLIEIICRKPIPAEKEGMIHAVGLILLLLLMVFVTTSDIFKLFGG